MLVLALIVGQTLGLPEIEDPIPERIGFSSVVGLAGAFGIVAGVIGVIARPEERERFVGIGTAVGFCIGLAFYVLSFLVQLLFHL